ncbi:MAG: TlpA family protein disulfide reductase [Chloroflexi bacterium]|nr:MAG: TlpA family protein disulfide reductase [Chloroflexota bacterium]
MAQRSSALKRKRSNNTKQSRNTYLIGVVVIAAALVGLVIWNVTRDSGQSNIPRLDTVGTSLGEIAPDFTVSTLDGGSFNLSANRGKPSIVFFMAYWCGTCIPEGQALTRLYDEYGDQLNIVAIDIDASSTPDALNQFKQAAGNGNYTWAFDLDQQVAATYAVRALDTTYVLDSDGYIVYLDQYPTNYDTLKEALDGLDF